MHYQPKVNILVWTLFVVVRFVSALPTGTSRLPYRQDRSVHRHTNPNPYDPCGHRGYDKDLQLTRKTIQQTNDTMKMIRLKAFRDESYQTGVIDTATSSQNDSGLVPLYRLLSGYDLTIQRVILEAPDVDDYDATLRNLLERTGVIMSNLLFKLRLTMRVAEELGGSTMPRRWTVDPIPLEYVGNNQFYHALRDLVFFERLYDTLKRLNTQLESEVATCGESWEDFGDASGASQMVYIMFSLQKF